MKRHLVFLPLIGLALVSPSSPGHAGDSGVGWDYKIISGAACQPQIGAQAGDFERYPFSIRNVAWTSLTTGRPVAENV